MQERTFTVLLVLVGLVHLLPGIGALSGARAAGLYAVDLSDPNLEILMRHRAVLFALLGAFLIASAFRSAWQLPALIAAAVSVGTFLLLAQMVGGHNEALNRVVTVDWIAAGAIVLATVLYALRGSSI